MGKMLLLLGLGIAALGLIVMAIEWLLHSTGGRTLPGDIVIRKGSFTLFFPLATCLLVSLVLTLAAWLVQFLRR